MPSHRRLAAATVPSHQAPAHATGRVVLLWVGLAAYVAAFALGPGGAASGETAQTLAFFLLLGGSLAASLYALVVNGRPSRAAVPSRPPGLFGVHRHQHARRHRPRNGQLALPDQDA